MAGFFFFFSLANLGFPLTFNFIAEFLILQGIFQTNTFLAFFCGISVFFAAVIGFWLFTRIFFGSFSIEKGHNLLVHFYDLTRREVLILLSLLVPTIFFGIVPNVILNQFTNIIVSFGV